MAELTTQWGDKVVYQDDQETRNKVFEKVMEYFTKYEALCGESIMQSDNPQIYAASYFADIADDIIKFKYVNEEE